MANDTEKRINVKAILDTSGFNSSLTGIENELKHAKSSFKNASAGVKAFGNSTENLKSVQSALSEQLSLQKQKVDVYKQSISKVTDKLKENISERERLKASLNSSSSAVNKIISQGNKEVQTYAKNREALKKLNSSYEKAKLKYGENSQECNKLRNSITQLEQKQQSLINSNNKEISSYEKVKSELDKLNQSYEKNENVLENNARKIQNYETKMNNASAAMNKTQSDLNKVNIDLANQNNKWLKGSETLKKHSKNLKNVGEACDKAGNKILALNAPLLLAGGAALKVGMDYESQMSRVKAIAGATGSEFKKLENQSLSLGASTCYSAKEVAQAQEEEASAGFKVNEILSATRGILDAAASSGVDLATATNITTSAIRGFGLDASQSGHVADVLARAAADTNANITSLGNAFQYIAPVAHSAGWSLESVSAACGKMADAGMDGSTSGTTLREVVSRLAKPSKEAADKMKALGMSFYDSNGKMKGLSDIVQECNTHLKGLTDQQKQNALTTIFGQQALSGMSILMEQGKPKIDALTDSLKNSDGAAKQMADTMQDNAKASVEQMFGSLETAAIKMEKAFAPQIKKAADFVGNLADKFSKLSPSMQNAIIKTVLFGTATGGLLKGLGGAATGLSGILGVAGKVAGVLGKTSKATKLAEKGIEGIGVASKVAKVSGLVPLVSGLGSFVVAAAPFIAGAAAIGLAGYGIHKVLSKEVVPSVDLFADKVTTTSRVLHNGQTVMEQHTQKISEETKKQVGAYMELDEKASKALQDLYMQSTEVTEKQATDLTNIYNEMNQKIEQGNDRHYQKSIDTIKNVFKDSKNISKDEQQAMLQDAAQAHQKQQEEENKNAEKIQQILQNAAKEHRTLSLNEQQEIGHIQDNMKTHAITALSEQKADCEVLQARMKDYGTRMSAEQASEIIKHAEEQKQKSVDAANEQYKQVVEAVNYEKNETGTLSEEQAKKILEEADKQRNDAIKKADEMKQGVVSKMKAQNSDLENEVNTSSGKILTMWDKLKNWWSSWQPETKSFQATMTVEQAGSYHFSDGRGHLQGDPEYHWTGSNYFEGGLTYLNEKGFELYDLPRGSRIYNHEASQEMVMKTAESVAEQIADRMMKGFSGNNGMNLTQNIYAQNPSPSEIARETRNSLMELSMQYM